jgi:NADPH2 dehydrogenase
MNTRILTYFAGYLIDQFLNPVTNTRTDDYGSTPSNRSRLALEVARAVIEVVGAQNLGFRLSPFSSFQGMHLSDPYPQFSDTIKQLDTLGLAYIHLVEPRVSGSTDIESSHSLDPLLELWSGPVLLAGGYTPELAKKTVNEEKKERDVVVVFGRYFISTPDLVFRLKKGVELSEYVRSTFYDPKNEVGYADAPFSQEWVVANA